jgi:hypothetical protein
LEVGHVLTGGNVGSGVVVGEVGEVVVFEVGAGLRVGRESEVEEGESRRVR